MSGISALIVAAWWLVCTCYILVSGLFGLASIACLLWSFLVFKEGNDARKFWLTMAARAAYLENSFSQRSKTYDMIPKSGLLNLFEDDVVQQQSLLELNAELQSRYSNEEVAAVVARCEVR